LSKYAGSTPRTVLLASRTSGEHVNRLLGLSMTCTHVLPSARGAVSKPRPTTHEAVEQVSP